MDLLKTKGTFGEHLKREREMRGVSLEEIANATRIGTRFLMALENEQWDRLPGGVFNRGFVRAVAHYLGLNEESMVAEYAMTTNDKPEVAVWVDTTVAKPKRSARGWLAALLLAALAAGGWFAWREAMPLVRAWRNPGPSTVPPASSPAASKRATPSKPAAPPAAEPVPAGAGPLTLKIEAGRATALKVVVDGKTQFDDRIDSGEQKRFEAKQKFEIFVGNSSAVLLELNGQTVAPLGPPGEAGTVTLTHKDVKKSSGGQD